MATLALTATGCAGTRSKALKEGLNRLRHRPNLVGMTSLPSPRSSSPAKPRGKVASFWLLQDAKARLSELVRLAKSEGPQHVTIHGREEVVVVSAEEFRRLKGGATGAALIAAMQACPERDIDLAPAGAPMPVRAAVTF